MATPWAFSTGRRGVSRVRVYERYTDGPLQIEYTGAPRQTLTNMAGVPVTDRSLATQIAMKLSERLERGAVQKVAREALGLPESRTLGELLAAYHDAKDGDWSESHRAKQHALRRWWLGRLGVSTELARINEAKVEREIRLATDARGWSDRTRQKHLRYITTAFRYGRRKLKWLREGEDLGAVDMPKPAKGGPSYSTAEVRRLLEAAPGVDARASAALEIAYDTQARARAILHLKPGDYDGGLLTFRRSYDKAKGERVAVLSPSAASAVERIHDPARPWLFMENGRRLGYDHALRLLRAVEVAAGVPHVPRRGWHGMKRRGVTDAANAVGIAAVSKQSGTLRATLERVYEQDDLAPKRELAQAMERLRSGRESHTNPHTTDTLVVTEGP